MERLVKEETQLQLYTNTPADSIRLLRWWMELTETGDISKILFPSCQTLASFINLFQSGKCSLAYVLDPNDTIKFAVWGEQICQGVVFLSLWCKPSFRRTKAGVQTAIDAYTKVFEIYSLILGLTKQEALLKTHKKWGYEILSKIPKAWGGVEDAWLVMLKKENFFEII